MVTGGVSEGKASIQEEEFCCAQGTGRSPGARKETEGSMGGEKFQKVLGGPNHVGALRPL